MLKSVPVSRASWYSLPKMPLVLLSLVVVIVLLMSVFLLVILWMMSDLFGAVFLICGHVRRLPIESSPR